MRQLAISALFSLLAAMPLAAHADPLIPYPNQGTPTSPQTITAAATGSIIGSFVGFNAAHTDSIAVRDLTHPFGPDIFYFVNQTTAPGTMVNFGSVQSGDVLEFLLMDATTGITYSSIAANSPDGISHAYFTPFTGGPLNGVNYVPGNYTYVGMEDLSLPYPGNTDLDYNDDQFLFSNIASANAATPEPSSVVLLGSGVLTLAGALRRRLSRA